MSAAQLVVGGLMLEESAVAAGVCGARSGRAGSRRKAYIVVIVVGQWWG